MFINITNYGSRKVKVWRSIWRAPEGVRSAGAPSGAQRLLATGVSKGRQCRRRHDEPYDVMDESFSRWHNGNFPLLRDRGDEDGSAGTTHHLVGDLRVR